MTISLSAKKEIRSWVIRNLKDKGYNSVPIIIGDGNHPPKLKGNSFRYENKSGNVINYPNAYRKAFGKPIYINSTRHILVGSKWLKKLEVDLLYNKLCKEYKKIISRSLAEFIFNYC